MAIRRIHIKHVDKGWTIKPGSSKAAGEVYPTKAKAIAAAERMAEKSDTSLVILVDANVAHYANVYMGTEDLKRAKPAADLRHAKKNPATAAATVGSTLSPTEKARQFRKWAAGHKFTSEPLSDHAISRESIYGDRGSGNAYNQQIPRV